MINFRYNTRSDWLKERVLSEYKARSFEEKADQFPSFSFRILNTGNLTQKYAMTQSNAKGTSCLVQGTRSPLLTRELQKLQVILSFRQLLLIKTRESSSDINTITEAEIKPR